MISLIASTNGTWCSCPSIKNGYQNHRYVFAWIETIEQNNRNLIMPKISIGNLLYSYLINSI